MEISGIKSPDFAESALREAELEGIQLQLHQAETESAPGICWSDGGKGAKATCFMLCSKIRTARRGRQEGTRLLALEEGMEQRG